MSCLCHDEITSGNATYDARGNMTKDPDGNEYHYDLDNHDMGTNK
jgi:hypothetical protein